MIHRPISMGQLNTDQFAKIVFKMMTGKEPSKDDMKRMREIIKEQLNK